MVSVVGRSQRPGVAAAGVVCDAVEAGGGVGHAFWRRASQAVQLDPKSAEAYVARGGSYHLLGQHEKGIEDRSRAIGLEPGSALGWTARGNAYFLMGRYDEALADLEQAAKLDPNNAETAQLLTHAKARVAAKIQEARAKELAPETVKITIPNTVKAPDVFLSSAF